MALDSTKIVAVPEHGTVKRRMGNKTYLYYAMKRLRCHNADTAEGKIFVAFIALIVRSYMMGKLTPLLQQNSYPFRKIQLELDKISGFSVTPNAKPCLTNPLTKLQRTIFELLDLHFPPELCM